MMNLNVRARQQTRSFIVEAARFRPRPMVCEELERRLFLSAVKPLPQAPPSADSSLFGRASQASSGISQPNQSSSGSAVGENEPATKSGQNDSLQSAQLIRNFGTGTSQQPAVDVSGFLSNSTLLSHEDDGSILLANATGLVAGKSGQIAASGVIGDGPNGSKGSGKGDYDYYKVPALANQLLTVNVDLTGSALDSVVAIYNSAGTPLAVNDNRFDNSAYGIDRSSFLRFLTPASDTYYVVVFGAGGGLQSSAFKSASGGGAASEGTYNLTIKTDVPLIVHSNEDNGSIPLATPVAVPTSTGGVGYVSATIGDGPHGSSGDGTGDFDFYSVAAKAGQTITADVDGIDPNSSVGLDTIAALYDSSGNIVAFSDDDGQTANSLIRFIVPKDGTYYVAVGGFHIVSNYSFAEMLPANPFDSASGPGAGVEGAYTLALQLTPAPGVNFHSIVSNEDDGSIPLANATGLSSSAGGTFYARGSIGDGPHGSSGTDAGDFDFYRVPAVAGQTISLDLHEFNPATPFSTYLSGGVYDSKGNLLKLVYGDGTITTHLFTLTAPYTDTYYIMIGGYNPAVDFGPRFETPTNAFDPSTGPGPGEEEANYTIAVQVATPPDVDYYSFDLAKGDVFGANVFGDAGELRLFDPSGNLLIASAVDIGSGYDPASPLPGGGNVSLSQVVSATGRYELAVSAGQGLYTLQLRDFRPALEQQPVSSHQILYLDFSGPTIDAQQLLGFGGDAAKLSPLSAFLGDWGLAAGDENTVIDSVVAEVSKDLAQQVSGVRGHGLNGDFTITGHAGDFQIEILNSRDNPGAFGNPNVSRIIIGGTLAELDAPFPFLGIDPGVDPGNFDTTQTGLVVLDALSDPADSYGTSMQYVPRAPGVGIITLIGKTLGDIAAHEAGHAFGNFHTDYTAPNIMSDGPDPFSLGPDGIFGTADDVNLRFETDTYDPLESPYLGVEDTLNMVAFGLSTGTKSGTYFDFVTGTLYVSGAIDDGRPDNLQVKSVGSNLQVYINGQLTLTRPAAGVSRIFLNGSSDNDILDASSVSLPTTLQGRGGNDLLIGGRASNLLFGGDGNDILLAGPGSDVLVGGDGDDLLEAGGGSDLLIGGRGADILLGSGGGDLLIAGTTSFDATPTALLALSAEWSSSRTYEARVANLAGNGSGPRSNQTYFLMDAGPNATVFDDSDPDLLTGGSGRDWYFAQLTGKKKDTIVGLAVNEKVD